MQEKDKEIIKKMMDFFEVSTIEEVAIKLGYSPKTANTWHSKGLTNSVLKRFEFISNGDTKKQSQKLVKYYPNIKLSAGDGLINYEDGEYQLIDASFLGFLKLKGLQNIEVVQVQGDSMMPYIEDGEYVVLERRTDARNGDIVVFVYENQSYIKQLQTIPNEAKLCFISKNPLYPSFEVRGDEVAKVAIIGVLRAKIRKF